MRSLSPVEAAVAVAIAGAVLASGLPAFFGNLHASRLVEPIDGLNRIATRATALAAGVPAAAAYPETVGLTPANVPAGEATTDAVGTWDHATWRKLDFEWSVPHYFSFAFESRNAVGKAVFHARAHGDLDGDGVWSTFAIAGESIDGAEPTTTAIDIHREVE